MVEKKEHYALPKPSLQNDPKVLIVVAPYYQSITDNLLKGAKAEILESNCTFDTRSLGDSNCYWYSRKIRKI